MLNLKHSCEKVETNTFYRANYLYADSINSCCGNSVRMTARHNRRVRERARERDKARMRNSFATDTICNSNTTINDFVTGSQRGILR